VGNQRLKLGVSTSEDVLTNDLADDGVFAVEEDTLATESNANLLHLVRSDVVNAADEDILVGVQQAVKLVVQGLLTGLTLRLFFAHWI